MPRVFLDVPPMIRGIIDRLIVREGGYVDNPNDPGGATNMGITFATLEKWREKPITKTDVKYLDKKEVTQIYFQWYWRPIRVDLLKGHWEKEFIFDWSVNSGLRNAVRNIQRLIGARPDGSLGPVTAKLLDEWMQSEGQYAKHFIVDHRIRWYIRLAESKHSKIEFVRGWFNRANEFRYSAT